MLSKSSKLELGFVHYIAKFTILRFVISRFECTTLGWGNLTCAILPFLKADEAEENRSTAITVLYTIKVLLSSKKLMK